MFDTAPKYPNRLRQTIDKCHLTVEEVAEGTNIPKRTLFDYCAGRVRIPKQRLEALADFLGYPADYLEPSTMNSFLLQSEGKQADIVWRLTGVTNTLDGLRRKLLEQLLYASGAMFITSTKDELVSPDAWERLSFVLNNPYRTDEATLTHLETLTNTYWELYRSAIAKTDLLSSASGHLLTVTHLLSSSQPEDVQKRLCCIISNTAQIVGEIYFDMNDVKTAGAYYNLAVEAAQAVGNHALQALALGRKGFLLIYTGEYEAALPFLQKSYSLAENTATGKSKSWIVMMEAEALSNLKRKKECLATLDKTIQVFDQDRSATGEDKQWTGFTHSTRVGYAGICYLHLHLPHDAQPMLHTALEALPPGPTRRRSIILGDLATAYMQQNEIEEACKTATQALSYAAQTKSSRALEQLRRFQQEMNAFSKVSSVKKFNEYMRIVKYV
jgi:tetratricopeptide (TPR) repeat protein